MTERERDMRKALDRMVENNRGRLIEAYKGEGGIVKTSLDELRIACERARRKRQRQAQSTAAFRGRFTS